MSTVLLNKAFSCSRTVLSQAQLPNSEPGPHVLRSVNSLRAHLHGGFLDSSLFLLSALLYASGPKCSGCSRPQMITVLTRYNTTRQCWVEATNTGILADKLPAQHAGSDTKHRQLLIRSASACRHGSCALLQDHRRWIVREPPSACRCATCLWRPCSCRHEVSPGAVAQPL